MTDHIIHGTIVDAVKQWYDARAAALAAKEGKP